MRPVRVYQEMMKELKERVKEIKSAKEPELHKIKDGAGRSG